MNKEKKSNGSNPVIGELAFTVLTILKIGENSDTDYTGYYLSKLFSDWAIRKVTHQQMYKYLRVLHENGLVEKLIKPVEGKPDRKCYRLTDYGKQIYDETLLKEEPKTKTFRSQYASMYLSGNREYFETLLQLIDDELTLIDMAIKDTSDNKLNEFAKMNIECNRLFKQAERDAVHMYLSTINSRNNAIGKVRAA